MSRWLKVTIAGLVVTIALGAGATVAVLAATSGGDEKPSPGPADLLVEDQEGRPWLGVVVSRFGDEGAMVQQVFADSPAHRAGVKRGDLIEAIDDQDVGSVGELVAALDEKKSGDVVTLRLVRDDEEITLQVTLAERPEPLLPREPRRPFAELGDVEFADILGGEFRVKDDESNTVAINMMAGEVKSLSDDQLTVALNDGGEGTFTITDDTVMPVRDLPEGAAVVVVTVGESDEARLVLPGEAFHPLGLFDRLRERIGERLRPMEMPHLDIPRCLKQRGFGPIREWHFDLRPERAPELMPLPDGQVLEGRVAGVGFSVLPCDGFWLWAEDRDEY